MTTASSTGTVAALAGVSKTYGQGPAPVHALVDVDLALPDGQLVVVLGPSGSGKTTLLNLLGAIEHPSTGRVSLGGTDVTELSGDGLADVRRETVGFVFQFFNLIPTLTARENVSLIAELTQRHRADAVTDVLAEVGLADRADHFPGQLSGGEQQRVAVARALAKQPRLLLCDEPTGALDPATGRPILELLQRQATAGRTVLVVTHNQPIAAMGDRVLRLRSGRIDDDQLNPAPTPAAEIEW